MRYASIFGMMLVPTLLMTSVVPMQGASAKTVKKTVKKARYSISSIPGADEKNFDNPTSRCLTKEMKAIYAKAVAQMSSDVKKFGETKKTAAEVYKKNLETIWEAMNEPYCGYGSRGLVAVKKSFLKSLERARQEFLKAKPDLVP